MLEENGTDLDNVSARFGCRTFRIDPENGFILNGKEYPLRGVSRHQDRWGIGNALLPEHHEEDMDLICELGATTIRLAHYQHDQYFYDLCDERGMVVWAEIPYISTHMPKGRENTISQMKELIVQNYNHPSIFVWGLSNEITMGGESDEDLLENHRILNDLVHEMDKTRLTTIACLSPCSLETDFPASRSIVFPDTLAHHVGGHRSGIDRDFAGGCLDEVGSFLHGKEGSCSNLFRCDQETGLKDHLEHDLPSGFGSGKIFFTKSSNSVSSLTKRSKWESLKLLIVFSLMERCFPFAVSFAFRVSKSCCFVNFILLIFKILLQR